MVLLKKEAEQMVKLHAVVHRVDTERHPTIPEGWRWCVHYGGAPWDEFRRMLNAGWTPSQNDALVTGEMVAFAAVKALRLAGIEATYSSLVLISDPIPAERDSPSLD